MHAWPNDAQGTLLEDASLYKEERVAPQYPQVFTTSTRTQSNGSVFSNMHLASEDVANGVDDRKFSVWCNVGVTLQFWIAILQRPFLFVHVYSCLRCAHDCHLSISACCSQVHHGCWHQGPGCTMTAMKFGNAGLLPNTWEDTDVGNGYLRVTMYYPYEVSVHSVTVKDLTDTLLEVGAYDFATSSWTMRTARRPESIAIASPPPPPPSDFVQVPSPWVKYDAGSMRYLAYQATNGQTITSWGDANGNQSYSLTAQYGAANVVTGKLFGKPAAYLPGGTQLCTSESLPTPSDFTLTVAASFRDLGTVGMGQIIGQRHTSGWNLLKLPLGEVQSPPPAPPRPPPTVGICDGYALKFEGNNLEIPKTTYSIPQVPGWSWPGSSCIRNRQIIAMFDANGRRYVQIHPWPRVYDIGAAGSSADDPYVACSESGVLFGSTSQQSRDYNDGGDPGRAATDTGWDPIKCEASYYAEADVVVVDANSDGQALAYDFATQRVFVFFGRKNMQTSRPYWTGATTSQHPLVGAEGPLWDFADDLANNPFGQASSIEGFCSRYRVLPVTKDIWLICFDAAHPYFRLRHVGWSGQNSTYRLEQLNFVGENTAQNPPPWRGTPTGGLPLAQFDGYPSSHNRGVVATPQGYVIIAFYGNVIVLVDSATLTAFTLVGRRDTSLLSGSPHCLTLYNFYEGVYGSEMRLNDAMVLQNNRWIAYVPDQNILAFTIKSLGVGLFVEIDTGRVRSLYLPTVVGSTPDTICTETDGVAHNMYLTNCGATTLDADHVGDGDPAQCGSDDFVDGDGLGAPNSMGEPRGLAAISNGASNSRVMVNVASGDMSIVTDFSALRNGANYAIRQSHSLQEGTYTATVMAYVVSTYEDSVALRFTVAEGVVGTTGVSSPVAAFNQWVLLTTTVSVSEETVAAAPAGTGMLVVDLGYPGRSLGGSASFTRLSVRSPSQNELVSNGNFAGGNNVNGHASSASYGIYSVGPACDFSQPPPSPPIAPSPTPPPPGGPHPPPSPPPLEELAILDGNSKLTAHTDNAEVLAWGVPLDYNKEYVAVARWQGAQKTLSVYDDRSSLVATTSVSHPYRVPDGEIVESELYGSKICVGWSQAAVHRQSYFGYIGEIRMFNTNLNDAQMHSVANDMIATPLSPPPPAPPTPALVDGCCDGLIGGPDQGAYDAYQALLVRHLQNEYVAELTVLGYYAQCCSFLEREQKGATALFGGCAISANASITSACGAVVSCASVGCGAVDDQAQQTVAFPPRPPFAPLPFGQAPPPSPTAPIPGWGKYSYSGGAAGGWVSEFWGTWASHYNEASSHENANFLNGVNIVDDNFQTQSVDSGYMDMTQGVVVAFTMDATGYAAGQGIGTLTCNAKAKQMRSGSSGDVCPGSGIWTNNPDANGRIHGRDTYQAQGYVYFWPREYCARLCAMAWSMDTAWDFSDTGTVGGVGCAGFALDLSGAPSPITKCLLKVTPFADSQAAGHNSGHIIGYNAKTMSYRLVTPTFVEHEGYCGESNRYGDGDRFGCFSYSRLDCEYACVEAGPSNCNSYGFTPDLTCSNCYLYRPGCTVAGLQSHSNWKTWFRERNQGASPPPPAAAIVTVSTSAAAVGPVPVGYGYEWAFRNMEDPRVFGSTVHAVSQADCRAINGELIEPRSVADLEALWTHMKLENLHIARSNSDWQSNYLDSDGPQRIWLVCHAFMLTKHATNVPTLSNPVFFRWLFKRWCELGHGCGMVCRRTQLSIPRSLRTSTSVRRNSGRTATSNPPVSKMSRSQRTARSYTSLRLLVIGCSVSYTTAACILTIAPLCVHRASVRPTTARASRTTRAPTSCRRRASRTPTSRRPFRSTPPTAWWTRASGTATTRSGRRRAPRRRASGSC